MRGTTLVTNPIADLECVRRCEQFRDPSFSRRPLVLRRGRDCPGYPGIGGLRVIGDYGQSPLTVIHRLVKLNSHPGHQVAWSRYTNTLGTGWTREQETLAARDYRVLREGDLAPGTAPRGEMASQSSKTVF